MYPRDTAHGKKSSLSKSGRPDRLVGEYREIRLPESAAIS